MATGIRKNDEVQVLAGKDRGKRGRVVNVLPGKGRVMVEGVARITKHAHPTKKNPQGGIVHEEAFIDISNVALVCKQCGRATRIGHRIQDGVKARVCRRCGAEV